MFADIGQINWVALQDPTLIFRIVLQALLFLASALFSMSETALFALQESQLQNLEQRRPDKARMLRNLLDEPRQLIISILCGNELINIAATINLAGIFLALYADPGTAALASTLIMLPLLLLLGEITPKTLAVNNPLPLCVRVIGPVMSYWVRIVAPLRAVIRVVADYVTTLIVGQDKERSSILQPDEFQSLLKDVGDQSGFTRTQRKLVGNLLEASSTDIKQIMVPRPQVQFIDATLDIREIIERFRHLRHRRVPVYRDHRDNIIGVLRDQVVLKALEEKSPDTITLEDLIEPPNFVMDTTSVSELAEFFKGGEHHAVMVINEFGGVEGLVSSDDVFDYLIYGRSTFLEGYGNTLNHENQVYECPGLMPLETLADATPVAIEDFRFSTLGGYVTHLLGRLPQEQDTVCDETWCYEVLAMNNLLIARCRISPLDTQQEIAY